MTKCTQHDSLFKIVHFKIKNMDCPFCKIINENTERIIKETSNIFVILSNPKLVPGHLLVIPKRHVEKFSELTEVERIELFNEAIKLEEKILKEFASGCDMTQHFRPFIKQNRLKVNHLHIHLRPRELNDELYEKVQKYEIDVFTELSESDFEMYRQIFSD